MAAARITCGARLGRTDWVQAARPSASIEHGKQRALLILDLAAMHAADGHLDKAMALTAQAIDTGIETRSGRLIDRARQLRRTVKFAVPPRCVQAVDDRLHGTYI